MVKKEKKSIFKRVLSKVSNLFNSSKKKSSDDSTKLKQKIETETIVKKNIKDDSSDIQIKSTTSVDNELAENKDKVKKETLVNINNNDTEIKINNLKSTPVEQVKEASILSKKSIRNKKNKIENINSEKEIITKKLNSKDKKKDKIKPIIDNIKINKGNRSKRDSVTKSFNEEDSNVGLGINIKIPRKVTINETTSKKDKNIQDPKIQDPKKEVEETLKSSKNLIIKEIPRSLKSKKLDVEVVTNIKIPQKVIISERDQMKAEAPIIEKQEFKKEILDKNKLTDNNLDKRSKKVSNDQVKEKSKLNNKNQIKTETQTTKKLLSKETLNNEVGTNINIPKKIIISNPLNKIDNNITRIERQKSKIVRDSIIKDLDQSQNESEDSTDRKNSLLKHKEKTVSHDSFDDYDDFDLNDLFDDEEFQKELSNVTYTGTNDYSENIAVIEKYQKDPTNKQIYSDIFEKNQPLVRKIAAQYVNAASNTCLTFDDLVSSGNLGMLTAIEKFDPTMGYQFSTYATYWIRQRITRNISDEGRMIRIPVHQVETILKLTKLENKMIVHKGSINDEKILNEMEIKKSKLNEIRYYRDTFKVVPSTDVFIGDSENSTLGEFVSSEHILNAGMQSYLESPSDQVENKILRQELIKFLEDNLTERASDIVIRRNGLNGEEIETLEEIGKRYGVTRERIRQIEAKSYKRLQKLIKHSIEKEERI